MRWPCGQSRGLRAAAASRPGAGGAFTLVELLVVAVILGLLAAMAIPRLGNSLARRRAEAAARRVAADLALAQRRARQSSAGQTVVFEPAQQRYRLLGAPGLDHPAQEYVVALSAEPYGAAIASVELGAASPSQIVFDGFGVPDSGGKIVLEAGGVQRTVTVDPDTGQASVQ